MRKLAQKPQSSFNETVPNTGLGMEASETQGMPQPKKTATVDSNSDQYAALPIDQSQGQEQSQGSSIPPDMVEAAQAFLGPEVMAAAMQGDPNAQDLVAKASAQFGASFMNMSAGASVQPSMGVEGNMAPGAMPGQSAPVGITSPEEDLASELVPNVNAMAQQQVVPQAGAQPATGEEQAPVKPGEAKPEGIEGKTPEQGGADQMVDIKTVAKLIQLAKQGHI